MSDGNKATYTNPTVQKPHSHPYTPQVARDQDSFLVIRDLYRNRRFVRRHCRFKRLLGRDVEARLYAGDRDGVSQTDTSGLVAGLISVLSRIDEREGVATGDVRDEFDRWGGLRG